MSCTTDNESTPLISLWLKVKSSQLAVRALPSVLGNYHGILALPNSETRAITPYITC